METEIKNFAKTLHREITSIEWDNRFTDAGSMGFKLFFNYEFTFKNEVVTNKREIKTKKGFDEGYINISFEKNIIERKIYI